MTISSSIAESAVNEIDSLRCAKKMANALDQTVGTPALSGSGCCPERGAENARHANAATIPLRAQAW
jgi:hypothetical protein